MLTDQQHPVTPPPELVEQLRKEAPHGIRDAGVARELHLITAAYRAGADAELNECEKWLPSDFQIDGQSLRAAMRPEPPSLAEQALEQLNGIETVVKAAYGGDLIDDFIRHALERLKELENND